MLSACSLKTHDAIPLLSTWLLYNVRTNKNRYTYLGQLLSHDMNHDVSSTLGVPIDPATVTNFNSPMVDLDTIYSVDVSAGLRKLLLGANDASAVVRCCRYSSSKLSASWKCSYVTRFVTTASSNRT